MSKKEDAIGSAEIYTDIRKKLIEAKFKATTKMKPEQLRSNYSCAASTMREVLFRLASDGFLDFEEQRGFRVVTCTEESLVELIHMRVLLETEGAKLSIEQGDIEWEAKLAAAHHKLAHIEQKMQINSATDSFVNSWSMAEWDFHATLISACGSKLMRRQHKRIYDSFRQHLLNLKQHYGFRDNNNSEHQAIVEAAAARDVAACSKAISNHLLANLD
ncbi:MAG: GntR family transcriptional regulator [Hyphomicrobiales bacterium]